ncbi:MAG: LptF/LptG family permease, partial [Muribaculaceae bacterium]|nr:LptF/LptG family permease [Muribaculaceae bacterium]
NGEQFENLREQALSSTHVPYRREEFADKEVLVKFDANFNRMDESGMRNQYVGKNIKELQATIDSVNQRVDSIGALYAQNLKEIPYFGLPYYKHTHLDGKLVKMTQPQVVLKEPIDVDSVFRGINPSFARSYLTQALAKANRAKQDYEFKSMSMQDDRRTIRRHGIELMKKFTLSMACLVFFFIGAPLGAIIRKGGLGTPLVISVFLFIFYWIVDNTGYKMARDGRLEVWEGIWLSTFVLLPLGIFFTYKAVNDSAVFNRDAYVNFFRKLFGRAGVRHLEVKEVVMDDVEIGECVTMVEALVSRSGEFLRRYASRQSYLSYWTEGYDRDELNGLRTQLETTVEYFSNSRDRMVILKLMDFPILRSLWFYHPSSYRWIGWCCAMLFPIGIIGYIIGVKSQLKLKEEIKHIITVGGELLVLMQQPSSEMSNKE